MSDKKFSPVKKYVQGKIMSKTKISKMKQNTLCFIRKTKEQVIEQCCILA